MSKVIYNVTNKKNVLLNFQSIKESWKKHFSSHLHWHESQEICNEGMQSAGVEFFLAEAIASKDALCQEEEDTSQQRLVCQSLICLGELHQSWKQNEQKYINL